VRVWNVATGKVEQTLEGHSASVMSVAFSPDGSKLASGSHDDTVRVWNVATGKVEQTLEGHSASVMSVAFSPDGSISHSVYLVDGSKTWVTWNGSRILYLPLDYRPATAITKGSTLALGTPNGQVTIITFYPDVKM
jgi:WD40 repeat protein